MKNDLKFEEPVLVSQPVLPPLEKYVNYLEQIWDKKWLTNNGPLHEELKKKFGEYLEVENLELFTNGHSALEIALKSLEITGEVITTPFTFASTTHALVNNGLTPVFCDVDPETYNIDANKIERLITKDTSAILAVHVFGTPCDVEKISQIAEKHNIKVIYDAAHAFGVSKKGIPIGNFGDISMFSLHATKVFHTIEGGILTYKDSQLSSRLNSIKNFGLAPNGSVKYVGTNSKMNEFQAAMGLSNMDTIQSDINSRKTIFETYSDGLENIGGIQLLFNEDNVKRNYSYFPILLNSQQQRNELHDNLKHYKVFSRKYFYPLCNDFECYDFDSELTPIAKSISERILCLPMYSNLNIKDVKQINAIIAYELGDSH